ncbi:MAG: HlyD family secretion protein [Crocinitomicaceae bacterium]
MSRKLEDIKLRSEDVQEILTRMPSWTIRWGITVISVILAMFIFVTWLIKYPDTIDGQIIVTSQTPPIRLVNKTAGTLESVLVKDGDVVEKGDPLARFENSINQEDIERAMNFIDRLERYLNGEGEMPNFPNSLSFGEHQVSWNELKRNYYQYQFLNGSDIIRQRLSFIQNEISLLQSSISISNQQVALTKKQLERQRENYEVSKKLAAAGTISKTQLNADEEAFENTEMKLQNLNEDQIQKRIRVNQLKKEREELQFDSDQNAEELHVALTNNIRTIKSQVGQRSMFYVIRAPVSGEVTIPELIVESQYYEAGNPLFVVSHGSDDYTATMTVPKRGAGKIKLGQKVRIALTDYPEDEFGTVEGKVTNVAKVPGKDGYRVNISLPKGLETSYKTSIQGLPEMTGQASIITEDLRLIQRIFDQFRKLFE